MLIHYKGLVLERFNEAPFIGSLFISPDCHHHCKGCFNQYLKDSPTLVEEDTSILEKIKDDPFSEGIIFAGLDPLTYLDELLDMVKLSLEANLKVMIYTFYPDQESLLRVIPGLLDYKGKGIWIKYGDYQEKLRSYHHESHGIRLATTNQYIALF